MPESASCSPAVGILIPHLLPSRQSLQRLPSADISLGIHEQSLIFFGKLRSDFRTSTSEYTIVIPSIPSEIFKYSISLEYRKFASNSNISSRTRIHSKNGIYRIFELEFEKVDFLKARYLERAFDFESPAWNDEK